MPVTGLRICSSLGKNVKVSAGRSQNGLLLRTHQLTTVLDGCASAPSYRTPQAAPPEPARARQASATWQSHASTWLGLHFGRLHWLSTRAGTTKGGWRSNMDRGIMRRTMPSAGRMLVSCRPPDHPEMRTAPGRRRCLGRSAAARLPAGRGRAATPGCPACWLCASCPPDDGASPLHGTRQPGCSTSPVFMLAAHNSTGILPGCCPQAGVLQGRVHTLNLSRLTAHLTVKRTEVDADRHAAQRVRRRDQAPRALHGAELAAPEAGPVVVQHLVQLRDQDPQIRHLPCAPPVRVGNHRRVHAQSL